MPHNETQQTLRDFGFRKQTSSQMATAIRQAFEHVGPKKKLSFDFKEDWQRQGALTFARDENGESWTAKGIIDLAPHGFTRIEE